MPSFEIVEKIAVLSEDKNGWTKEVNIISWNGREPKIDIRSWSNDHDQAGKGITLTTEEAALLYDALEGHI